MEPPRLPDTPPPPVSPAAPPPLNQAPPPVNPGPPPLMQAAPPLPGAQGTGMGAPPLPQGNMGKDWLGEAQKLAPKLLPLAGIHLKRAMAPDIAAIVPQPEEAPLMEAGAPGRTRLHSLLAWRRSLLIVCSVLFAWVIIKDVLLGHWSALGYFVEAGVTEAKKLNPSMAEADAEKQIRENTVQMFGESNLTKISLMMIWLPHLGTVAGYVFLIMALREWHDFKKTRKLLLFAWMAEIAPRLLMLVVPMSQMMDMEHLRAAGQTAEHFNLAGAQFKTMLAAFFIGACAIVILPLLLGTAFGALRASLTVRYFAPASAPAGWLTLCIATAISIAWLFVTSLIGQAGFSALVYTGALCLTFAPLSLWRLRSRLIRPMSGPEASATVRVARGQVAALNGLGILLLAGYAIDNKVLSYGDLISAAISIIAHLFLVSVICVDWLLPVLRGAHSTIAADERPDGRSALDQLDDIVVS